MSGAGFRYAWLTLRRELRWFPVAFLAVFVLILWMMRAPNVRLAIARAYLGFLVPLLLGIMAAYSVLDDPAIELRFATRVRPVETLTTRLGLIAGIQIACAIAFQVAAVAMGVDFTPLGDVFRVQAAWCVPAVSLAAVGTTGALLGAQCATGAFVAAAVWLIQLLMKSWMLANASTIYLFMGILEPKHPDLVRGQLVQCAGASALLLVSWRLLHRQERYL
jgi:hypothetical protein